MAIMTWLYDHAPKPVQVWLDSRAFQQMADKQYDEYLTRKEAGMTTVLDRWNFEPHEPSAELYAVMALSGDRTNAGTLPDAAFKSAVEDRMSEDVAKAKANLHQAREHQQERAADFWQRTLDVGRQQQQSCKQMREAEREVSKETPRLKV